MKRYDIMNVEDFLSYLEDEELVIIGKIKNWKQFKHCQAWYCEATLGNDAGTFDVYLLQSYWTMVAVYRKDTGECIRLGKYSPTTSKQTTQWENALSRARGKNFFGEQVALW